MGFEPTVPLRVHTPSKRAPSATRSSLPETGVYPPSPGTEKELAERVGFEPTEPQAAQRFSRPPDSTALASLPDLTPCPRGFEPPAFGSAIQCSIQLSYGHMKDSRRPAFRSRACLSEPSPGTRASARPPASLRRRPRHPCLRRGGDSNPRYPLEVQRLSRAPDSATLAPLQFQPPRGQASTILNNPLNFALASVTKGRWKGDRRGRDSNPRNRGAAQRFSRPPPSTTRTPLPRTKNAPAADSTRQRAAAHFSRSPSTVDYTHRPVLCQQNRPWRTFPGKPVMVRPRMQTVHGTGAYDLT